MAEIRHFAKESVTTAPIIEHTGLHNTQAQTWLKLAVQDGYLKKVNRPVRYLYQGRDNK